MVTVLTVLKVANVAILGIRCNRVNSACGDNNVLYLDGCGTFVMVVTLTTVLTLAMVLTFQSYLRVNNGKIYGFNSG